MPTIVHEFTVTRTIRREDTEFELSASFDIFPAIPQQHRRRGGSRLPNIDPVEGGRAELVGEIFLVSGGIPWDRDLTKREIEKVENSAYEAWAESQEPIDRSPIDRSGSVDDSCVLDDSFDAFDDDFATKVSGRGEVFW